MIDQFSDAALTQLRAVIREEVRSEVATQLKPVNEKLDHLVETEREDTDSLNSVVMQNVEDIKRIKQHIRLPVSV